MKKHLSIRRLVLLMMSSIGTFGFTNNAFASGYQLWEQDGASIGNYHAGRAAEAADASTAYYNPAGLVRIPNQEVVVGADPIVINFKYDGTTEVNTLPSYGVVPVVAQGGSLSTVPDFHYSAPITDNLFFGLSLVSPFGLKTDYGDDTFLRYTATLTSLKVIDLSPSIGFAINKNISVGIGLDAEYAKGQFNLIGVVFDPSLDTESENTASSHAYGFHAGILYQYSDNTRIGLAYHSKITHRMHGESEFEGLLANNFSGGTQTSNNFEVEIPLPATTTLSYFHTINPTWDVMATLIYTKWDVLDEVVLENVAGIEGFESSNDITVIVPENYNNSWNYSVGANYHASQQLMLRFGLGYDQTPTNNKDRNVELPDTSRIVTAVGGHYQATKSLGLDLSWAHYFMVKEASINDNTQVVGDQVTVTNGKVRGSADIYGLQVKWDFV